MPAKTLGGIGVACVDRSIRVFLKNGEKHNTNTNPHWRIGRFL